MADFDDVNPRDLALARIRVVLAEVAPEIPEEEIVLKAGLEDELCLDVVSIWQLATGLEKLARVEIPDAAITAATTIEDFAMAIEHSTARVSGLMTTKESDTEAPAEESTNSSDEVTDKANSDPEALEDAMEDLAKLFNS